MIEALIITLIKEKKAQSLYDYKNTAESFFKNHITFPKCFFVRWLDERNDIPFNFRMWRLARRQKQIGQNLYDFYKSV